jgi:hypothetical protein
LSDNARQTYGIRSKESFAKGHHYPILGLTKDAGISILAFVSKKKEFAAKGCVRSAGGPETG